ncbi:ImmA/IrrE family metallo-endopeptidase [Bartonella sp. LJL80]
MMIAELNPELKAKIEQHLKIAPVKIGDIAKDLGVIVKRSANLKRSISGSIKKVDGRWFIYINRFEAPNRQRYTLAHMLSHFILHQHVIEELGGVLNDNVLYKSDASTEIDNEARRLALELIVPSDLFIKRRQELIQSNKGGTVECLASEFRIPRAIAALRLIDVHLEDRL